MKEKIWIQIQDHNLQYSKIIQIQRINLDPSFIIAFDIYLPGEFKPEMPIV